ncbi:TolC family protein [Hyalangium minutum]|uniref:Heavy metal RND efflux outer membrane protein, CzcC family protein n=1 Tax=Hyalangium minutum TaxID=394096 RepID=A0A085WFA4_9BACT|nr:TolC family protein [Hyalangium minutum]KFE66367.1 Heavy metal RND efflux outer membrane protein, CzcC family protein [Hyalangium minutum]
MSPLALVALVALAVDQAPPEAAPAATPAAPAAVSRKLTFQEVLVRMESQNLDLQAARARLAQAQELSSKAWSGYLPQISAGASYTRNSDEASISLPTGYAVRDLGAPQNTDDPTLPGTPTNLGLVPTGVITAPIQVYNQFGAQVQLNQALLAPALCMAIKSANIAEDVAALNVEAARREILFGAAQLYFGAAGLKEAVTVQERLLEVQTAREKDAQLTFDAGAQPKVALLRAQIDKARSEQDLVRARNSYLSTLQALATLMNEPADFDVVVPEEPVMPEGIEDLERALQDRPDVAAARRSVDLAETGRSAVKWKYAPSLGLSAAYRWANVGGFTGKNTSWLVTVGLQWVLWDGGLREAELRESSAKIAEAKANAANSENKVRDEIRRGLLDLASARANRLKAERQLQLARESQRLVDVSFKAGTATYLEVTDANTALAAAETGFVGETLNASLAALRVLKAAGRFAPPAQQSAQ